MQSILMLQRLAVLAVLPLAWPAMADSNACYYPSQKICVEDGVMTYDADCSQNGGEEVAECPELYRLGTCEIVKQGKKVLVRYYEGTQINPRQSCRSFGGVYFPE